jgi:hypothetical protein
MKKAKSARSKEMRGEYHKSDFPAGFVRGKYAKTVRGGPRSPARKAR